ncbi:MAG: trypsin-like peptidase domain-containing protein [Alphaproteobacteria bacterium]
MCQSVKPIWAFFFAMGWLACLTPFSGASAVVAPFSFSPIVKKTVPAVVNIHALRVVAPPAIPHAFSKDPFFKKFMGDLLQEGGSFDKRVQNSLGSGVIITPEGLVVTNEHVIRGAQEIFIVLSDKREFKAAVVGRDLPADLAILKILKPHGQTFPFLELENIDTAEVGDCVLAIGNPFGIGQTVTSGIISALAKSQSQDEDFRAFIQTDAAVNPGNSGGALVNLEGKLIGLNTAIFAGASSSIGFATPSDLIMPFLEQMKIGKAGVRSWVGSQVVSLNYEIAKKLGLEKPEGALVTHLISKGPGDLAGLKKGDVILEINQKPVEDAGMFRFKIACTPLNTPLTLLVLRQHSKQQIIIKTSEAPVMQPENPLYIRGRNALEGATVLPVTPGLIKEMVLPPEAEGLIILDCSKNSRAYAEGFRQGDVLLQLEGETMTSTKELLTFLAKKRGRTTFLILRGREIFELHVE